MTDLIAVAAISNILGLMIGYFFKRWNREYLTKKDCDKMREGCIRSREIEASKEEIVQAREDAKFAEFKKEMRDGMGIIKGLLLVLASGGKVEIDELKELLK